MYVDVVQEVITFVAERCTKTSQLMFVLFLHIAMDARNFCRFTRNFWCMTFFLSLLFNCAQMTTDDSNHTPVTEASDEKLRMPLEVERHSDPLVWGFCTFIANNELEVFCWVPKTKTVYNFQNTIRTKLYERSPPNACWIKFVVFLNFLHRSIYNFTCFSSSLLYLFPMRCLLISKLIIHYNAV